MMQARERLAELLTSYLSNVYEAAGLSWTADNAADMDVIAELVAQVAQNEAHDVVEGAVKPSALI